MASIPLDRHLVYLAQFRQCAAIVMNTLRRKRHQAFLNHVILTESSPIEQDSTPNVSITTNDAFDIVAILRSQSCRYVLFFCR